MREIVYGMQAKEAGYPQTLSGARKIMQPFSQVHGHQAMVGDRQKAEKIIPCAPDKQKE